MIFVVCVVEALRKEKKDIRIRKLNAVRARIKSYVS